MPGGIVDHKRRNGRHAENVVELARFRGGRIAPAVPPQLPPRAAGPHVSVQRDSSGRITYEYDVELADAKSVMSICLMIAAKLLAKLPSAA